MRFADLSLTAQTAYAEILDQTQALELAAAVAGFPGAFHRRRLKSRDYWYFGYRDIDGRGRMVYVGPDSERVRALVDRFAAEKPQRPLRPLARAAIALGCQPVLAKHFRIVKRLAEYGFFRAGGLLIGTHAFIALGNLLGVRWGDAQRTQDVDFAHAGRNVSIALPANVKLSVHDALTSLEMGLLPALQFSGGPGAHYRNPVDPELRLDFVTVRCRGRAEPVAMPDLGLALQPLKFMEYLLQAPTQGCVLAAEGACVVNLPDPARFAVHKLLIFGERPTAERAKAMKDLMQAAALADYFAAHEPERFTDAWRDAISRGKGWASRAEEGRTALLRLAPELGATELWR